MSASVHSAASPVAGHYRTSCHPLRLTSHMEPQPLPTPLPPSHPNPLIQAPCGRKVQRRVHSISLCASEAAARDACVVCVQLTQWCVLASAGLIHYCAQTSLWDSCVDHKPRAQ